MKHAKAHYTPTPPAPHQTPYSSMARLIHWTYRLKLFCLGSPVKTQGAKQPATEMAELVEAVKQQVEYMTISVESQVMSPEAQDRARNTSLDAIIAVANRTFAVTTPEATQIIQLLTHSEFNLQQRSKIIATVNGKRGETPTPETKGRASFKLQSCLSFHQLLTPELWEKITDPTISENEVTVFFLYCPPTKPSNLHK